MEGGAEAGVEEAVEGPHVAVPQDPAGDRVGADPAFEAFGELAEGGVVIDADILAVELRLKRAFRGGCPKFRVIPIIPCTYRVQLRNYLLGPACLAISKCFPQT